MFGGDGIDRLEGGDGWDSLYAGDDNETLDGGKGWDYLSGGNGWDYLYGGEGTDWLYGGDNHDGLWAGDGNDWLYGDAGNDFLFGGGGIDTFFYAKKTDSTSDLPDLIIDFESGIDKIDVRKLGIASLDSFEITKTSLSTYELPVIGFTGRNAAFTVKDKNSDFSFIINVRDGTELTEDDFLFATPSSSTESGSSSKARSPGKLNLVYLINS